MRATPKPAPQKTAPPNAGATPAPTAAPADASADPDATPTPLSGIAMGGQPPDDGAGPGRGNAIGGGSGDGYQPGSVFPDASHDAGPGTVLVGILAATTSVLALGVLGVVAYRRRRGEQDAVAVAIAGAAVAAVPAGPLPIPPPPGPPTPPPWQTLTGRAPAKFDGGASGNVERRTISYRFVRLSDGPDDLRSREVGRLDRGDEVEVLGEQDGMLHVRTATGLVGWVPRVVIVG